MRWALAALISVHGFIHLLGAAKGLDLAEVAELAEPVSRAGGVLWLVGGLAFLVVAGMFLAATPLWWIAALLSIVLSQALIVSAWPDAKFGTVANVAVLLLAVHGAASLGPWSQRARFERAVARALADSTPSPLLVEADLVGLPAPVARYVRLSGAVGHPRPRAVRSSWKGRIRSDPDGPWMQFTADQLNVLDPPARYYSMAARRAGVPVDVLHVFEGGSATMSVRLLSLFPLVDASGPELTRAETVTILNDLAMLAPAALVGDAITWRELDAGRAEATFRLGPHTVMATLTFDQAGDLVDFVSDDRGIVSDEGDFLQQRWSTPLAEYREFGSRRAAGRGVARWHPADGPDFSYVEVELVELSLVGRGSDDVPPGGPS